MVVEFIDLKTQLRTVRPQIDAAVARVLDHGKFIMGPEVAELEQRLAEVAGAAFCATCGNGTDALVLALKASGVGPGDAVIVPSFTFAASAESIVIAGATPIFVDVNESTFNMDENSVRAACQLAADTGLYPGFISTSHYSSGSFWIACGLRCSTECRRSVRFTVDSR